MALVHLNSHFNPKGGAMSIKLYLSFFLWCLLSACGDTVETEDTPDEKVIVSAKADETNPVRTEPDGCTKRCRTHAGGEYKTCIAKGGDAVECRMKAGEISRTCVETRCGGTPSAPKTEPSDTDICRAKCATHRLGYQDCIDDGGTEVDCKEKVGTAMKTCLEDC